MDSALYGSGSRHRPRKWSTSCTGYQHKTIFAGDAGANKKFVMVFGDSHLRSLADGFVTMPLGNLRFGFSSTPGACAAILRKDILRETLPEEPDLVVILAPGNNLTKSNTIEQAGKEFATLIHSAQHRWNKRAVDSFFEGDVETIPCDISPELDSNKKSNMKCGSEPLVCIDLTEEEPASGSSSTVEGGGSKVQTEPEDNSRFSVLTWNIDGLDITNPIERARGICSYIALYSPDVVFLQEVVPPYLSYLKKRAVSYTIVEGNEDCYFTAVMLKKSRVKLLKTEIIPFPSTSMMRNLLTVQASFCGIELHLMTSHLESTKNHSGERINQLKTVLTKIKEAPETSTVIFGGDTNLRDQEVAKIGGLPSNVCDIWEYLGKPEHCRYTWDTKTNHNLQVNYISRMRFDRVFFRASKGGGQIIPQNMDLIGLEKLDCGKFPSDHWGIYCDFRVVL